MGIREDISFRELNNLISEFNIQVDALKEVKISSLSASSHLFRLEPERLTDPQYRKIHFPEDTFVISTPAIRDIACFPHLVGKILAERCQEAATVSIQVMKELWALSPSRLIIYDILRAAPGYRMAEGFQELGWLLPHIQIRPHYRVVSYRDHLGNSRIMEVLMEDFSALSSSPEWTVIKPDTEASGNTSKIAIERLIIEAKKKRTKIKEIICLGFISVPAIGVLEELAEKYNFKLKILAWGNITALYQNNYDMPVYGLDESIWREHKKIRKLGSIIPLAVLKDYLPYYIPGADQPGDWSARQSKVSTGKGWEEGGIEKHLQNSFQFINNIYQLSQKQPWFYPWHKKIIDKELKQLIKEMKNRSL